MNRILGLALLLSLGLAPAALADDPKTDLIEKLLVLTNTKRNTENLLEQIKKAQIAQLNELNLPPEKAERAKELQRKIFDLLYEELNWESLKADYIELYAAAFSEEELGHMVDFYDSPAGRRLIEKMPILIRKSSEMVQGRVQKVLPKIRQLMREVVAENHASPPAPPGHGSLVKGRAVDPRE